MILYDGVPATNHLMHNLVVDVADDGETARAPTYVHLIQGLPDFPPQTIATGIYRGRAAPARRRVDVRRADDRWQPARRPVASPASAARPPGRLIRRGRSPMMVMRSITRRCGK